MADPIDRKHLEQLRSRFGGPFLVQLIDLFVTQGRERIAGAEAAAAAGDGKGVAAAAHALKSSAGNLGALALGARAADVERRGSSESDAAILVASVAGLLESFGAACEALESVRSAAAQGDPTRR